MTDRASGTTGDRVVVDPPADDANEAKSTAAGAAATDAEQPAAATPETPATDAGEPPTATAAAPATDAGQPAVKGLDRRRGIGSVLSSAALAWVVAIVALAAAIVAGTQWADLYAAERTRSEVREDARSIALQLTTFEGQNIESWYTDTLETATGDYAEQLRQVFDQATRDQLRDIEAVSRGEVDNLFVQDIDGDEASAFAVVTQTYANASTGDPVEDHLRMDITLRLEDGEWRASDVAVLGPAGVVAPTGPEGGEQAPSQPADPGTGGDQ